MNLLRTTLLSILLLCACADTGSRGPQPNVWSGAVGGYWWQGATAQEQQWLTETLNLHNDLASTYLGASPRVDVFFYPSVQDLNTKANQISVSHPPNAYNLSRIISATVSNGPGIAFLHDGAVHIYCGPKQEGAELAHSLIHAVLGEMPRRHIRPNINASIFLAGGHKPWWGWSGLLADDWLLSVNIAARR